MQAYRIWGSVKLFPQHSHVPNLSSNAHLKAFTEELQTKTEKAARSPKQHRFFKSLAKAIRAILMPTNAEEQWVDTDIVIGRPPSEDAPIVTMQRISDAPEIMQMRDPIAKRNLITMACIHCRQTQNNTPGALPKLQELNQH